MRLGREGGGGNDSEPLLLGEPMTADDLLLELEQQRLVPYLGGDLPRVLELLVRVERLPLRLLLPVPVPKIDCKMRMGVGSAIVSQMAGKEAQSKRRGEVWTHI